MVKTLTPIGNSLGLIIDKAILELLRIDQHTPLEVSTEDGKGLIIRPVPQERRERVRQSAKRLMKSHAETLKKLAK